MENNLNRIRRGLNLGTQKKVLIIFLSLIISNVSSQTRYYSPNPKMDSTFSIFDVATLDFQYLFYLDADLEEGIKGVVTGENSRMDVRVYAYDGSKTDGLGREIYHIWIDESSEAIYTENHNVDSESAPSEIYFNTGHVVGLDFADAFLYNSNDIKGRAQFNNVFDRRCGSRIYHFMKTIQTLPSTSGYRCKSPIQPVVVELTITGQATLNSIKIPGVGLLHTDEESDGLALNIPGYFKSFCDSPSNQGASICSTFNNLRSPRNTSDDSVKSDLFIAAHRGWWGYELGTGPPENSLESVRKAKEIFPNNKIIEMDLTLTSDNELVFMHDYVLSRLTNYPGDEFSFRLPLSTIDTYYSKRRDGALTTSKISRFKEVLEFVKDNDMILMVDVKELQSKGAGVNCVANCDFESSEKKQESWKFITRQILRQAESLDAKKNLIIKTYYSYNTVMKEIGPSSMNMVLWTPMIVPNNFLPEGQKKPDRNLMIQFIDDWHAKGSDIIACFETNFFAEDDIQLKSFTHNGDEYENLPHYIFDTTGRRSGFFSEEPVDPKGTVNRWGSWSTKNTTKDIRTDFAALLNIPYGRQMLITTDRIDLWVQINELLNDE